MVAMASMPVAYSGTGYFGFDLQPKGVKAYSNACTKTDDYGYAKVIIEELDNLDSTSLYYRIWSNTNDTAATSTQTVTTECTQRPAYISGYGLNGYAYYIRMQTDSSSINGAEVSGKWLP
jgi:hypothetical protein